MPMTLVSGSPEKLRMCGMDGIIIMLITIDLLPVSSPAPARPSARPRSPNGNGQPKVL